MKRVGRYHLLDEIARGGMGVVYRAEDPTTGRPVAIKVLLDPDPDPRFRQEARALARLTHKGIVVCHDLLRDEHGRDVLVMEWVDGESLKQRLDREGPLPIDEALRLTLELCEAVAYAHAQGVIHRDLKPQNVLVTAQGQVKLTDFGLGKVVNQTLAGSRVSLTKTGEIMGTPAYMPPEQAEGNKAAMGPRSDVYSLGATLYALLTGRPPFRAPTTVNLLHAVLEKVPEPPSTHRPEVPARLDAVVLRCLAKDPAQRFARVEDLAQALRDPAPEPSPALPPPQAGRGALLVSGALAGAGLVTALLLVGVRTTSGPPSVGAPAPEPVASEDPVLRRIDELMRAQRHDDAMAVVDQALRTHPSAELYNMRGSLHVTLKDLRAALRDFSDAIALRADDYVLWLVRGRVYRALNDWEHARADFEQARDLAPERPDAWFLLGALHGSREPGKALDCFDRAIALDPRFVPTWLSRAGLRQDRGDLEGAFGDYSESIRLAPSVEAYLGRASLRLERRQFSEAVEDLQQALRCDAKPRELARVLPWLSKAREREDAYRDDEGSPEARRVHRLGLAHTEAGRVDDACDAFDEALRLDPNFATAYRNRGQVKLMQDDRQGALDDLSTAIRLAPDRAYFRYLRGGLYLLLRRPDAALQDIEAGIEADPTHLDLYLQRGAARFQLGQDALGMADYDHVLQRCPFHPTAQLERGRQRARLGDRAGAIDDCRRVLELSMENDDTWEGARALLAQLGAG